MSEFNIFSTIISFGERKIWGKIVNGAGLAEHLKIKKTISDDDNDEKFLL